MRRANIRIRYDNVDISEDISSFLTGFTYTDEAHGKQDSISICLHDRDGRWRTSWWPEEGAALTAAVDVHDWLWTGDDRTLECGAFEIDELAIRGSPWTLEIKCVAVPVNAPLRNTRRTRAWQGVTVEGVLLQIASENGMEAFFDAGFKPVFKRIDQRDETDAQFLTRMAGENGLCFKATGSKLVMYDIADYEQRDAAFKISANDARVSSFSFSRKADSTYTSCTAAYWDAAAQRMITCTWKPETAGNGPHKQGKELRINRRFENPAQARAAAKKALHDSNRKKVSGTLSMMGEPLAAAGLNVGLEGLGKLSGKYHVDKAVHSYSPSRGYTSSLDVRMSSSPDGVPPSPAKDGQGNSVQVGPASGGKGA